jgi:hypothetical protein
MSVRDALLRTKYAVEGVVVTVAVDAPAGTTGWIVTVEFATDVTVPTTLKGVPGGPAATPGDMTPPPGCVPGGGELAGGVDGAVGQDVAAVSVIELAVSLPAAPWALVTSMQSPTATVPAVASRTRLNVVVGANTTFLLTPLTETVMPSGWIAATLPTTEPVG